MATKTITISFQDRAWKMIHDQAAANGQSPAEYMREAILDKLQDDLDYEEAISNIHESDDKNVSHKEVRRQLGFNTHEDSMLRY